VHSHATNRRDNHTQYLQRSNDELPSGYFYARFKESMNHIPIIFVHINIVIKLHTSARKREKDDQFILSLAKTAWTDTEIGLP